MDIVSFFLPIEQIIKRRPVVMQALRFLAIGFLNTGLSFIVSNLVSKYFGITEGGALGLSSGVGFLLATAQSYYWNKYWAFGNTDDGLLNAVFRLAVVGCMGVLSLFLVYVGSQAQAAYVYYGMLFIVFFVAQWAVWSSFRFESPVVSGSPMATFFTVSFIGFAINFLISSEFSRAVHLTANADINKNIALVAATAVSMVWNFLGYKLLVFKK